MSNPICHIIKVVYTAIDASNSGTTTTVKYLEMCLITLGRMFIFHSYLMKPQGWVHHRNILFITQALNSAGTTEIIIRVTHSFFLPFLFEKRP